MRRAAIRLAAILTLGAACVPAVAQAACPVLNAERRRVELVTSLGSFCLDLLDRPGEAPLTVEHFLGHVRSGDYDGTFFHRLVPGFVLQGGGYRFDPVERYEAVPQGPAVVNEPGISNRRLTVAMAKRAGEPNSATNQFFLNLDDNTELDTENGGFTVFARVSAFDGAVPKALGSLRTEYGPLAIQDDPMDPLVSAFTNLPVLELLVRDPDGYGCLIVAPDPTPAGEPRGISRCTSQAELDAAIALTIAAMDPQVPERLVLLERVVEAPEPGAPLLAAAGTLVLAALGARRRERGARRPRYPRRCAPARRGPAMGGHSPSSAPRRPGAARRTGG